MKSRRYSIDLIKQMAECDANYIKLLKLIPGLRAFRTSSQKRNGLPDAASHVKEPVQNHVGPRLPRSVDEQITAASMAGKVAEFYISNDPDTNQKVVVEITVIEAFKYTTTLEIVQRPAEGRWISNPAMQVRVYHDASTAEVMSYQSHKGFLPSYPQPNPNMYYRDEKIQVNRFLGEWLTHCLAAGRCTKVPDLAFNF